MCSQTWLWLLLLLKCNHFKFHKHMIEDSIIQLKILLIKFGGPLKLAALCGRIEGIVLRPAGRPCQQ